MAKSFDEVLALPAPAPDEVFAYGNGPLQFAEIYRSEGAPKAVVGLIHGGCWQNAYDVAHVRPVAHGLRREGYLVSALEYRRLGDEGGGWPGTFDDVGAAVDALGELAAGLPVLLAGHSAGGHLALWAAVRPRFPSGHRFAASAPLKVAGVLGLAAITDLVSYAAGSSSCQRATPALLGGAPQAVPERYAAVSPLSLVPLGVPIALVQGMDDSIVPSAQAETLLRAVLDAGERGTLRYVPGAGHFDHVYPGTLAWHTALASLRELL